MRSLSLAESIDTVRKAELKKIRAEKRKIMERERRKAIRAAKKRLKEMKLKKNAPEKVTDCNLFTDYCELSKVNQGPWAVIDPSLLKDNE
jgi:hypothetical protein